MTTPKTTPEPTSVQNGADTPRPTTGLSPISPLRAALEAVLLVADGPLDDSTLAELTEASPAEVSGELEALAAELDARGSGIELRRSAQGVRVTTRPSQAEVVEKLVLGGTHSTLSRAALETLAVVAYRQPVTRAQVAAVRGVNVDAVMRTLKLRGLITEVDAYPSTWALRYVTTELFLEQLGLDTLEQLPSLAPLLPDIENIDEDFTP